MTETDSATDRWGREIELQKVFGLTPNEATVYVLKESGMSASDISETTGASVQVVKNVLTSARRKIKGDRKMDIYIMKPNMTQDPNGMKINGIMVLTEFAKRVMDMKVRDLKHVIHIHDLDHSKPGSVEWMNSNVFRYIDIYATRNAVTTVSRAESMVEVYNDKMREQGIEEPMMGYAVLRYWLDQLYLNYDMV